MQAVILAAGRGTRMNGLCESCPKPMLDIQGKPKLEHTMAMLPKAIDEVIFIVGYLKEVIQDHFGKEFQGKNIRYVEQEHLDGTGGAIDLVKGMVRGRFLVLMGDDLYMRGDLERMMEYDLAVLANEVEDASGYAVIEVDAQQRLERIVEAPHSSRSRLVNTAAYVLVPEYFDYPLIPKAEGSHEYGLPQTFVTMRDKHDLHVEKATRWLPIGTPEALELAQKEILHYYL